MGTIKGRTVTECGQKMETCVKEARRILNVSGVTGGAEKIPLGFAGNAVDLALALYRTVTRPEIGQEEVAKMAIAYLTELTEEKNREAESRPAYTPLGNISSGFLGGFESDIEYAAQSECKHETLQALSHFYLSYADAFLETADELLEKFCVDGSLVPPPGEMGPGAVVTRKPGIRCPECFVVIDPEEIKSGCIIQDEEDEDAG